jgi:hypothetical protein
VVQGVRANLEILPQAGNVFFLQVSVFMFSGNVKGCWQVIFGQQLSEPQIVDGAIVPAGCELERFSTIHIRAI